MATQKEAEQRPDLNRMIVDRALACFHENRFESADVLAATVVKDSNLWPFALYVRGVAAMCLGQLERARQFLTESILANPANAEAHASLGLLLLDNHQYPAAVAAYAAALNLDSRNAIWHFGLAKGLAALGLSDLAVDSYRDACALVPNYTEAESNLRALLSELDETKDASAAPCDASIRSLDRADPRSTPSEAIAALGDKNKGSQSHGSSAVLCDALLIEGIRHHDAGDFARSKRLFERVLSLDPDHVNTLCNLGTLVGRLGDHRLALDLLERAVALAPELLQTRLALAEQHRLALSRAPKSDVVHAAFAMALEAMGDHAGAMKHFEQTLKISQRQPPEFFEALGRSSLARGNLQGAEISFQHALALQPKRAPAHSGLGNVWLARGRPSEVIACFQSAIDIDAHCRAARRGLEQAQLG